MRSRITIFFVVLCIIGCSSTHNTVRLQHDTKTASKTYSLSTEHYLSVDGDKVLELDRGERTVLFQLERRVSETGRIEETIRVTLKIYENDGRLKGRLTFNADGKLFEAETQNVTSERSSETITVLDSGQRQLDNPNLANSAQAQTGYITFGKPTAAGAANRNWVLYHFNLVPEVAYLEAMRQARAVSATLHLGRVKAEMQWSDNELKAWRKFLDGGYDEKIQP